MSLCDNWKHHPWYFLMTSSHIITEYGKQNIFAKETQPRLVEDYTNHFEEAEKTNGRWAMLGFVALLGAYITTGQIIPGVFKCLLIL